MSAPTTSTPIPAVPRTALAVPADTALTPPVVETSAAAAAQMARTNLEARFSVALARPRDWERVRRRLADACQRARFAEEARYSVPRGDKDIEGLTVRFAEEAARALGNLMIEAMVTFDDDTRRIVRVIVTDLEDNLTWPADVVVEKTTERRSRKGRDVVGERINSEGEKVYIVRATDEEVVMKQNGLVSRAARNGVLRYLPADLQEEAMATITKTLARAAASGAGSERTARLVAAFAARGITAEHLAGYLGHSLDTLTPAEYTRLVGIGRAIEDGETTWEQVVKDTPPTARRAPRAVKDAQGAYGASQKTEPRQPPVETINMADKPSSVRPLPPDPYQTTGTATASPAPEPAAPEPAEALEVASDDVPLDADGYPMVETDTGWRLMTAEERRAFERAMEEAE